MKVRKKYLALARVSSREQEREGFSLEVQETALERYAEQHDGKIVKLFRIAETASKPEERQTFKELAGLREEACRRTRRRACSSRSTARPAISSTTSNWNDLEFDYELAGHLRHAADREHAGRADDAPHAGQHGQLLHRAAIARREGRPRTPRSRRAVRRQGTLRLRQRPPRRPRPDRSLCRARPQRSPDLRPLRLSRLHARFARPQAV